MDNSDRYMCNTQLQLSGDTTCDIGNSKEKVSVVCHFKFSLLFPQNYETPFVLRRYKISQIVTSTLGVCIRVTGPLT